LNNSTQNYDLIIVGAGLVGAALAAALATREATADLRIALVEAGGQPEQFGGAEFDPRVVALTHASQRLLEEVDAWSFIVAERACPFREMQVWDGEGTASIHFDSLELRSTHLGHIVENALAVRALRQSLQQASGVELMLQRRVESLESVGSDKQVQLDNGQCLRAPLVIAADGAQSRLRELAGFDTREWDYGQSAIVASVRCEKPHAFTAWQRFMRTGPLAFLPLVDGDDHHWCSIVWSAETSLAESLMALNSTDFCVRLGESFEYRLGKILQVSERFCIPLRQRHARDYVQPGIALVGDAAHNIHPLAGQGVNLGLLDVDALVTELARARQRDLPLSDFSILRRYQRQRLGGNLAMMAAMEGFKRLFGAHSLTLTWLRNWGLQQVNDLPALKNLIVKQVMG
jgi:2-octaprenylphenol hydroxylase